MLPTTKNDKPKELKVTDKRIFTPEGDLREEFRDEIKPVSDRFIRRTFAPEMVATWPSVPEIFPEDGKVFVDEEGRLLDRDLWKSNAPLVRAARRFRDELNAAKLNVDTHVIAGDCIPTARRILARRDGTYAFYPSELRPNETALAKILFEPGDGTVPIGSATAGGDALIVCDGHQGIAQDPTVQRAIIRILREEGSDPSLPLARASPAVRVLPPRIP